MLLNRPLQNLTYLFIRTALIIQALLAVSLICIVAVQLSQSMGQIQNGTSVQQQQSCFLGLASQGNSLCTYAYIVSASSIAIAVVLASIMVRHFLRLLRQFFYVVARFRYMSEEFLTVSHRHVMHNFSRIFYLYRNALIIQAVGAGVQQRDLQQGRWLYGGESQASSSTPTLYRRIGSMCQKHHGGLLWWLYRG